MLKNASAPLKAAVLGLGLAFAVQLQAQTSTSGSTSGQTTSSQTTTGTSSDTTSSGQSSTANQQAPLRDAKSMIGATLSTTGGRYGTISDVVFDGSGNVQYVLADRQGQLHPVPFALLQFGATGDMSVAASSATLDAVTVDRNDLQSMSNPGFATRLRAAFGPSASRAFADRGAVNPGTGNGNANPNSTAGQRDQVFSLASLLGGAINAQGGDAGTLATVAITSNGQIAFAVGTNATGDARFAFPLQPSMLNNTGNGFSLNTPLNALTGVSVPAGSLPSLSDQSFVNSFQTAFGDRALGLAGRIAGLSQTESDNARRNDSFNRDPVVRAGDASRGGADAVASTGDSRRGGADAVSRAGDRTGSTGTAANGTMQGTTTGSINGITTTGTTTGSTSGGGLVNATPEAPASLSMAGQGGVIQLRDLLNFKIQAQDGSFGQVADIVLDSNGNVQYMIGSYQGQSFPLPFSASAMSGSTPNTLQFNVPMATLQQLAIDMQNLPSMNNQAFTQRMQEVFGTSFQQNSNQNTAAYVPGTGVNSATGATTGTGSIGTTGSGRAASRPVTGTTQLGALDAGTTGTTGAGTAGSGATAPGTGMTPDNWVWPNSPASGPRGPGGTSFPGSNPFTKNRTGATGTSAGDINTPSSGPRGPGGTSFPGSNPFTKNRMGTGTGTGAGNRNGGTSAGDLNPPSNGPRGPGGTSFPGSQGFMKSRNGNTNNSGTGARPNSPPIGRTGTGTTGTGTSGSGGTGTGTTGGSTGGASGGSSGGGAGGASGGSGS